MKIVTIIGARPQFIKSYAISNEIDRLNHEKIIEEIIVHTGQHYDENMSDIFFNQMKLRKPKYILNLGGKTHGQMTGQMIIDIEKIILKENPDYLLIYGDTNSTLAGAIAASKLHIPIIHVEAGLRSYNRKMPEEINRIISDELATFCFCPTSEAVKNLKKEGIIDNNTTIVKNVGDIMYDVMQSFAETLVPNKSIQSIIDKGPYLLATIHRAENTDYKKNMKEIFEAFNFITEQYNIVLPLHPRTKKQLENFNIKTDHIICIDPVSYLDMQVLLKYASGILTDSGGLQKEAYFAKKFCITLRDETEWIELVQHKVNILTGANKNKIIRATKKIAKKLNFSKNFYGDGDSAQKIMTHIWEYHINKNL